MALLTQQCHLRLQGKTTQLEQILKQKEVEIERLQHQLEAKKSSGSSESSGDVCANLELGDDPASACAEQVTCLSLLTQPYSTTVVAGCTVLVSWLKIKPV